MLLPVATVVAGLILLVFAADRFVLAAARLSRAWGMSPVLVGALIVGMGTSAPELLVSTIAATRDQIDLALGNVVGSNVANVTMVLGGTALLAPLAGNLAVLKREGAAMLVAVTVLAYMLWDLQITRTEGLILVSGMVVAAWLIVRWAKLDRPGEAIAAEPDASIARVKPAREVLVGTLALALTLAGAEMLVRGGMDLAASLGVDSAFIGMTLVAAGTSLPELATSIAGIRQGEHDLVLGNVVGSNLFNALAVGGIAALIGPGAVDPGFRLGAASMVICAAAAGFLAVTGKQLVRWEAVVLLAGFVGYVGLSYDPTLLHMLGAAIGAL